MSLRAALSVGLCGATLVTGLATCFIQNSCHARAEELSRIQREWEMVAAANAQARAIVSAHVWGVSNDELDAGAARRPGGEQQP